MFVNEIEPEPAVLMLYLNVRLSCFKLSILVDLYINIFSKERLCSPYFSYAYHYDKTRAK